MTSPPIRTVLDLRKAIVVSLGLRLGRPKISQGFIGSLGLAEVKIVAWNDLTGRGAGMG